MKQNAPPSPWKFPLIMTILVMLLFCQMLPPLFQGYRSQHWPSTGGVIESAKMTIRFGRYVPVIEYRYLIGGEHYRGSRVSFASQLISQSYFTIVGAKAVIDRYPAGKHVKVYYEPASPGTSVLNPGVPRILEEQFLFPGAAIVFTLYLVFCKRRPNTALEPTPTAP
jgi:Protein of unknown function (DUF3592)